MYVCMYVWEGGVREPGIVHWPGTILPRIESEPVATYDIYPTILKLAGADIPTDRTLDGKDMMPLLLHPGTKSPHTSSCIFYWKGCSSNQYCGTLDESPLLNKKNPGLWAVRCGAYKTHFVATTESCMYMYIYIYIYVCVCVCVCVCVYVYIYIYVCVVCMHLYIYIYIYVCVCVFVCL